MPRLTGWRTRDSSHHGLRIRRLSAEGVRSDTTDWSRTVSAHCANRRSPRDASARSWRKYGERGHGATKTVPPARIDGEDRAAACASGEQRARDGRSQRTLSSPRQYLTDALLSLPFIIVSQI